MLKTEEIIEFIYAAVTAKGRGALREFERELAPVVGFSPENRWLTRIRAEGNCKLSVLVACLNHLGITLDAFGGIDHSLQSFEIPGPIPFVVEEIRDGNGPGIPDVMLDQILNLRFSDPSRTIALIESLAKQASRAQKSFLFSTITMCYRALMRYPEVFWCYRIGDQNARSGREKGELRLRLCHTLHNLNMNQESRQLAEAACMYFARQGHLEGMHESLVVSAYCRMLCGEIETAKSIFKKCYRNLDWLRPEFRLAVLQQLSKDDPSLTEDAFTLAETMGNMEFCAKVLWLAARDLKPIESAIDQMRQVLAMLPEFCFMDRAFALIDLSLLLLEGKRYHEASVISMQGFALMEHGRLIPGFENSLRRLVDLGIRGNISIQRLVDLRSDIALCRSSFLNQQSAKLVSHRERFQAPKQVALPDFSLV